MRNSSTPPLLRLEDICVKFGFVEALKSVNLSIQRQEVIAIVGDNGAGKSTLMKCLFGIYKMDAGEIYLDGEKIVEIKVQKQENRVKVTVFNTGTPIPEADLPNLWNKFYKVDKARTREYGGSGIGLSIVKAIMEGMNQQYGVQNFDNGVEFWFTLDRK